MGISDLQTFVDSLEDAIVVIDENLRVVFANTAALRGCGLTANAILQQPCYVSLHGRSSPCDDRPMAFAPCRQCGPLGSRCA